MLETSQAGPPTTLGYLGRGLGYAAPSILCLLAGYWMAADHLLSTGLFILVPPACMLWIFSVTYAICFHYQNASTYKDPDSAEQRSARWVSVIIAVPTCVAALLGYNHWSGRWPHTPLTTAILIHATLMLAYQYFLLTAFRRRRPLKIRHQLVWPVILAIAVSLYFGRFVSVFESKLSPLQVLIPIVFVFLTAEVLRLPKWAFLSITLAGVAGTAIALQLAYIDQSFFSTMLFCIGLAGYLAVFEASRITAHVAYQESQQSAMATATTGYRPPLWYRYYLATTLALVVSAVAVPVFYVFTELGDIFIVGFGVHAVLAFALLYWAAVAHFPARVNWVLLKVAMGFFFLGILLLDLKLHVMPEHEMMRNLVSWSGFFVPFFLAGCCVKTIMPGAWRDLRRGGTYRMLSSPARLLGVAAIACTLGCAGILLSQDLQNSRPLLLRSERAFVLCGLLILLVLLASLLIRFHSGPGALKALRWVWGTVIVTRLFTSLVVGAIVAIPQFQRGVPLALSVISAAPFVFAAMGGFALNDFFDFERDRINKPHRAIPSGMLSRPTVFAVALVNLSASVLLSVSVAQSGVSLSLYLAAGVGVCLYNGIVRYLAATKALFTATLCAVPIVFDLHNGEYPPAVWLFAVAVICFVFGREVLMDVCDIEGDRAGGSKTLPMLLGTHISTVMGFALQIVGVACLFPLLQLTQIYLHVVLTVLAALSVAAASLVWVAGAGRNRRRVVLGLWVPMISGISIFLTTG